MLEEKVQKRRHEGQRMYVLRLLTTTMDVGGHAGEMLACSYSSDGKYLLTSGWDGCLHLWETSMGVSLTRLKISERAVPACAISPCGQRWLLGSFDGFISSWDPLTHQCLRESLLHTRSITRLAPANHNSIVAAVTLDPVLRLFTFQGNSLKHRALYGHEAAVNGCCFSEDDRILFSWSIDGTVRLWDVPSGKELALLQDRSVAVKCCDVSGDGLFMLVGYEDGTLQLWDLDTWKVVHSIGLGTSLLGCAFLFGDRMIVTADVRGRVALFSVEQLHQRAELNTRFTTNYFAVSPLGTQLALGCISGRVHFVGIHRQEPPTGTTRIT